MGYNARQYYTIIARITKFSVNFFTHNCLFLYPVKKKTQLHRGELLKNAVQSSRLNKEDIAAKAGYTRSSYYKHIQEPDLPYHILAAYGKALRHDFTDQLPEMPRYLIEEPEGTYAQHPSLEEALRLVDHWKSKYIDLLERFNRLVLEQRK